MGACVEARWDEEPPATAVRVVRVVLSLGSFDALRGIALRQTFPPHAHETYALGVIEAGANRLRYRGADHLVPAGAVVAIPPGELHTGGPVSDAGWSYRMIYPDTALMRFAMQEMGGENRDAGDAFFDVPVIRDGEIAAAMTAVHRSLTDVGCCLAREERLLVLLRTLVRRHAVRRAVRADSTTNSWRVVSRAREYMEEHFAEPLRLAQLAEQCDVSPYHLIRVFRREVGMPPHQCLKQLRVSRAQAMLRTGAPVTAVAYRCGFSDQAHLTRTFKSIVGVPPGVYARAVRGNTPAA